MRSSTTKILYSFIAVAAILAFATVLVHATYEDRFVAVSNDSSLQVSPISTFPASNATSAMPDTSVVAATPVFTAPKAVGPRLSIPILRVDAPIENVGIDANGNMATPNRLANVGWYQYGTKIGDVGSAVIAGHVDNSLALPAVFYHLKSLKAGDDIYVTSASGTKLHFVVTAVDDYALADAPVKEIFDDTSGDRLIRLITCEGTWDKGSYSYDHRIVVTAKLV